MTPPDSLHESPTKLPGLARPGMEHNFHVANGLYSKWATKLSSKWPNVE